MTKPVGSDYFSTLPKELAVDILNQAANPDSPWVCKSWNAQINGMLGEAWNRLRASAEPSPFNVQGRMQIIEACAPNANNYAALFKRLVGDMEFFYGETVKIPFNEMQCTHLLLQLEPEEARVCEGMNDSTKIFWFSIKLRLGVIGLPEDEDVEGIRNWLNADENLPLLATIKSLTFSGMEDRAFSHLAPEIGRLVGLEELYMNHCSLRELPPQIGDLTSLKTLQLHAHILKEIPLEIGKLTTLGTLDISCGGLPSLPSEIEGLVSLKTLDASDNNLRALPSAIGGLVALESLDISDNQVIALPSELADLPSLETLRLDRNPLMLVPDPILKSDRPVFASNPQIQQLKEERRFVCTAPLAQLYQAIILKEKEKVIKEIFADLPEADKLSIYEQAHFFSNHPLVMNLQEWGEDHVFDDMDSFYRAVRKAIIQKYEAMPSETQIPVHAAIYALAGRSPPPTQGFFDRAMSWLDGGSFAPKEDPGARLLAMQNIPRLAEAMGRAV